MAVDPILEVDEKVVEEVAQKCDSKNEEPATPEKKDGGSGDGDVPASPDPYYPPIIYLPEVVVNSGEEDEEEAFRRRAKLYRYAHEEQPAEWKERGTGEVKIMRHPETGSARIIMRREKTMRMCANHSILPWMDLRPNCGSQKAWVWKTQADFADALSEEDKPKQETLAIRFATVDNAEAFKAAFLEARQYVLENQARQIREEERGEADGEEAPDLEQTAPPQNEKVEAKTAAAQEEKGEGVEKGEAKCDGENAEDDVVVSKIADLAV